MPKWTPDQQTAIDDRGGALLVSAAAGSGKTAVLTERVLRRLTDKNDPVDIDRLLLVTFTNAAAAEMRERIGAALGAAVAANPRDTRLRRQLFLVHRAKITTVHALCLSLAREQAAVLGIAPDFRLMDENEGKLLRAEVLEEVLDTAYEQADEKFFALCDLLTAGRDDKKLGEVILGTYEKIQAHPDPRAFLEDVRAGLYTRGMDTPHGCVLREQARSAAQHGAAFLHMAVDELTGIDELADNYLPALTSDLNQAERLLDALYNGSWDDCVKAARSISFDRLKAARKFEDKAFLEQIKAMREEWKGVANNIREKWLTVTAEEAEYDRGLTAPALFALIDMVNAFDDAFTAAKRARNAADFNDLEHFAVRLLYTDGKPSALAKTMSEQFTEIAVDEYQDTNAVQDAIFRALSRDETNLFMVGDVKQSIYGFRLADPSIFLEKYRSFGEAADAADGQPRRVVLGQNFRSRAAVLDACNYLFAAVMGETVGDLVYTDKEALHLGADYYPESGNARYKTEVLLVDADGLGEDDDAPDKTELEARLAAKRIRALLDEGFPVTDKQTGKLRPVTPGDIVILLRSPRSKAPTYIAELERIGVTASAEQRGGLLETAEVGTMVSLLSVIDNPRQDVDLIGVMRSPLFGFTEQELADIRLVDRRISYYDALLQSRTDFPKVETFLQRLDFLRTFACDQPVYRLLWEIYDQTGALGLYGALPNGAQRQSNLLTFFERARSFEGQGFRGLFDFVRLLRGMLEQGEDFQTVGAEATGGAVRILSIHKSKGLEFPVVIVADCAKQFNDSDLKEPVLVHQNLGFGSKCRDRDRGVQYDTAERIAVSVQMRREMISEELRVLYVAMTRAKEKLILTAATGSLRNSLKKWSLLASLDELPQYAMGAARTPLAWILTPLLRHPCARAFREEYAPEVPEHGTDNDAFTLKVYYPNDLQPQETEILRFEDRGTGDCTVQPHLDYPHAYLADLPSKLTATGVGRGYRADEAAEQTPPPRKEVQLRAPLFEKGEKKLTPAEIGTAHHLFMQFCDFDAACASNGVENELNRLAEKKILSTEQAHAVDKHKIERFFASDLYKTFMAENKVRREFKFSVLVPAQAYFPVAADAPEENVLLQGVIDCLIETGDGFVILDFKTDRIKKGGAVERAEQYRPQLAAYARAVHEIYGRPVRACVLYFFHTGDTEWVSLDET